MDQNMKQKIAALVFLLTPVWLGPAADIQIQIEIQCGTEEPIVTTWSGDYTDGATDTAIQITVETETHIGVLETNQLPTHGAHSDWPGIPLPGGPVHAAVFINNQLHTETTADCTPQELPLTGIATTGATIAGGVLLAAGAILIAISRRRRLVG